MKLKDIKIGMKVVPFRKRPRGILAGFRGLNNSVEWRIAKQYLAYPYLYVSGFEEGAVVLSTSSEPGDSGDYFAPGDFHPYKGPEPTC